MLQPLYMVRTFWIGFYDARLKGMNRLAMLKNLRDHDGPNGIWLCPPEHLAVAGV